MPPENSNGDSIIDKISDPRIDWQETDESEEHLRDEFLRELLRPMLDFRPISRYTARRSSGLFEGNSGRYRFQPEPNEDKEMRISRYNDDSWRPSDRSSGFKWLTHQNQKQQQAKQGTIGRNVQAAKSTSLFREPLSRFASQNQESGPLLRSNRLLTSSSAASSKSSSSISRDSTNHHHTLDLRHSRFSTAKLTHDHRVQAQKSGRLSTAHAGSEPRSLARLLTANHLALDQSVLSGPKLSKMLPIVAITLKPDHDPPANSLQTHSGCKFSWCNLGDRIAYPKSRQSGRGCNQQVSGRWKRQQRRILNSSTLVSRFSSKMSDTGLVGLYTPRQFKACNKCRGNEPKSRFNWPNSSSSSKQRRWRWREQPIEQHGANNPNDELNLQQGEKADLAADLEWLKGFQACNCLNSSPKSISSPESETLRGWFCTCEGQNCNPTASSSGNIVANETSEVYINELEAKEQGADKQTLEFAKGILASSRPSNISIDNEPRSKKLSFSLKSCGGPSCLLAVSSQPPQKADVEGASASEGELLKVLHHQVGPEQPRLKLAQAGLQGAFKTRDGSSDNAASEPTTNITTIEPAPATVDDGSQQENTEALEHEDSAIHGAQAPLKLMSETWTANERHCCFHCRLSCLSWRPGCRRPNVGSTSTNASAEFVDSCGSAACLHPRATTTAAMKSDSLDDGELTIAGTIAAQAPGSGSNCCHSRPQRCCCCCCYYLKAHASEQQVEQNLQAAQTPIASLSLNGSAFGSGTSQRNSCRTCKRPNSKSNSSNNEKNNYQTNTDSSSNSSSKGASGSDSPSIKCKSSLKTKELCSRVIDCESNNLSHLQLRPEDHNFASNSHLSTGDVGPEVHQSQAGPVRRVRGALEANSVEETIYNNNHQLDAHGLSYTRIARKRSETLDCRTMSLAAKLDNKPVPPILSATSSQGQPNVKVTMNYAKSVKSNGAIKQKQQHQASDGSGCSSNTSIAATSSHPSNQASSTATTTASSSSGARPIENANRCPAGAAAAVASNGNSSGNGGENESGSHKGGTARSAVVKPVHSVGGQLQQGARKPSGGAANLRSSDLTSPIGTTNGNQGINLRDGGSRKRINKQSTSLASKTSADMGLPGSGKQQSVGSQRNSSRVDDSEVKSFGLESAQKTQAGGIQEQTDKPNSRASELGTKWQQQAAPSAVADRSQRWHQQPVRAQLKSAGQVTPTTRRMQQEQQQSHQSNQLDSYPTLAESIAVGGSGGASMKPQSRLRSQTSKANQIRLTFADSGITDELPGGGGRGFSDVDKAQAQNGKWSESHQFQCQQESGGKATGLAPSGGDTGPFILESGRRTGDENSETNATDSHSLNPAETGAVGSGEATVELEVESKADQYSSKLAAATGEERKSPPFSLPNNQQAEDGCSGERAHSAGSPNTALTPSGPLPTDTRPAECPRPKSITSAGSSQRTERSSRGKAADSHQAVSGSRASPLLSSSQQRRQLASQLKEEEAQLPIQKRQAIQVCQEGIGSSASVSQSSEAEPAGEKPLDRDSNGIATERNSTQTGGQWQLAAARSPPAAADQTTTASGLSGISCAGNTSDRSSQASAGSGLNRDSRATNSCATTTNATTPKASNSTPANSERSKNNCSSSGSTTNCNSSAGPTASNCNRNSGSGGSRSVSSPLPQTQSGSKKQPKEEIFPLTASLGGNLKRCNTNSNNHNNNNNISFKNRNPSSSTNTTTTTKSSINTNLNDSNSNINSTSRTNCSNPTTEINIGLNKTTSKLVGHMENRELKKDTKSSHEKSVTTTNEQQAHVAATTNNSSVKNHNNCDLGQQSQQSRVPSPTSPSSPSSSLDQASGQPEEADTKQNHQQNQPDQQNDPQETSASTSNPNLDHNSSATTAAPASKSDTSLASSPSPVVESTTNSQQQPSQQQQSQIQPQKPQANNRSILIIREIDAETPESKVREIFNSENCPCKPVHCEHALNTSWYVNFRNDEDAKSALYYLRKNGITWNGSPIMARYKPKPAVVSNTTSNLNQNSPTGQGLNHHYHHQHHHHQPNLPSNILPQLVIPAGAAVVPSVAGTSHVQAQPLDVGGAQAQSVVVSSSSSASNSVTTGTSTNGTGSQNGTVAGDGGGVGAWMPNSAAPRHMIGESSNQAPNMVGDPNQANPAQATTPGLVHYQPNPPMMHHMGPMMHSQHHHPHHHQQHHNPYGYSAVAYYGQHGPILSPWHYPNAPQYDFSEVFIYNGLAPYPTSVGSKANNNGNNARNNVNSKQQMMSNSAAGPGGILGASLIGGEMGAYHIQTNPYHHHHQQQQHHHQQNHHQHLQHQAPNKHQAAAHQHHPQHPSSVSHNQSASSNHSSSSVATSSSSLHNNNNIIGLNGTKKHRNQGANNRQNNSNGNRVRN